MGKLGKRNQDAARGSASARAGSSQRSHPSTRPKRARPTSSNGICFPPTCATRPPLALHCRSNLWTAATTFTFSLAFYSIEVFGRKVKEWRQLCVHFPARVQPARMQFLAVRKQKASSSSFTARELESGFGLESHRAWMERHDPVVGRIAGERAGGRGINLGSRISRRQDGLGDRVGGLVRKILVRDHEILRRHTSDFGRLALVGCGRNGGRRELRECL
jgi:hypothetical protein